MRPARDAVQLVRCVESANTAGRDAIIADYTADACNGREAIAALLAHMALFVCELAAHNQHDDRWLKVRMSNLVPGEHEDAHRLVHDGAFNGDWTQFWEHVGFYTTHDDGQLEELILHLAHLGNCVLRTEPNLYESWPADFYEQQYQAGPIPG
ncbi:hypothetical protein [Mycobacterium sp. M23085]|uniref:hypothetical protein n=1 Tax=Mycobacterium sp. M23085 TaxID=3378087 RepID=UPI00387837F3